MSRRLLFDKTGIDKFLSHFETSVQRSLSDGGISNNRCGLGAEMTGLFCGSNTTRQYREGGSLPILTTGSAELLTNRIGKEVLIGSGLCAGLSFQSIVRPLFSTL